VAKLIPLRTISIEKIRNLLRSYDRNIQDAQLTALSIPRRFEAAYDAGFCCAMALLEANKLETEGPSHHRETLDFMVSTLSLKGNTADLIPLLVRTRNSSRYDAAPLVTENMVVATLEWSARVQTETHTWFQKHNPQALKP
jgi:hypothetical protein